MTRAGMPRTAETPPCPPQTRPGARESAFAPIVDQVRAYGQAARRDDGQTMAEYGLIMAGVFVLVAASVFVFGSALAELFQNILAEF